MAMPKLFGRPFLALILAYLLTLSLRLSSTSSNLALATPGFPQDIFASPAFFLDQIASSVRTGGESSRSHRPVTNSTAVQILLEQSRSRSLSKPQDHDRSKVSSSSSLTLPGIFHPEGSEKSTGRSGFTYVLQRTSPTSIQLCAIPDFTADLSKHTSTTSTSSSSYSKPASKRDLIKRAQSLLEPLKKKCLYHTLDWFTYSFCHGQQVRQFRSLNPSTAAASASAKAGGGPEGAKAGERAAREVAESKVPKVDPDQDAYTLGRWKEENDAILGDDGEEDELGTDPASVENGQSQPNLNKKQPLPPATAPTKVSREEKAKVAMATAIATPTGLGTELIEIVKFGDWDSSEMFPESNQGADKVEDDWEIRSRLSENTQRYISQTWSDGTICDISNEPRSVEVQFHCSKRAGDRIAMIKETTTCNYVLVIETSRLCQEPAFASGREEKVHEITCHDIVPDDWPGAAFLDQAWSPDGVGSRSQDEKLGGKVVTSTFRKGEGAAQGGEVRFGQITSEGYHVGRDREALTRSDPRPLPPGIVPSQEEGKEESGGDRRQLLRTTRHREGSAVDIRVEGASSTAAPEEDEEETSHTFGDLSQFNSVHDDYFDTGVKHDHDHDHDHEHVDGDFKLKDGTEGSFPKGKSSSDLDVSAESRSTEGHGTDKMVNRKGSADEGRFGDLEAKVESKTFTTSLNQNGQVVFEGLDKAKADQQEERDGGNDGEEKADGLDGEVEVLAESYYMAVMDEDGNTKVEKVNNLNDPRIKAKLEEIEKRNAMRAPSHFGTASDSVEDDAALDGKDERLLEQWYDSSEGQERTDSPSARRHGEGASGGNAGRMSKKPSAPRQGQAAGGGGGEHDLESRLFDMLKIMIGDESNPPRKETNWKDEEQGGGGGGVEADGGRGGEADRAGKRDSSPEIKVASSGGLLQAKMAESIERQLRAAKDEADRKRQAGRGGGGEKAEQVKKKKTSQEGHDQDGETKSPLRKQKNQAKENGGGGGPEALFDVDEVTKWLVEAMKEASAAAADAKVGNGGGGSGTTNGGKSKKVRMISESLGERAERFYRRKQMEGSGGGDRHRGAEGQQGRSGKDEL
ncbi:hypothetical protein IE53DRAFT_368169 [Violaceomyces palustris]|uniref:Uncharacterized protein n=1 Tax=Violaceomyces palustris TaxID=1673888 RepID=A0ACD0P002_9BASI|nr:hypothetical protein IE53DRAFT_368169 [Violaceomyces palustris]